MIIIGYKPLYCMPAGIAVLDQETVVELVKDFYDSENIEVHGCLWWMSENSIRPAFVCDKAKAVYDHLMMWSEGEPHKWFKLEVAQKGDNYCLNLMPNISRSTERMKNNFNIDQFGDDFKILFKSIYLCAKSKNNAPIPQPNQIIDIGIIGLNYENESLNVINYIEVAEPSICTIELLEEFINIEGD